jgi:hypothetical protein
LISDEKCVVVDGQVDMTSENILVGGNINKVVLYNDGEMEVSINSNEEKYRSRVMLGSFTHIEDSDSLILTRYASSNEDKDCQDLNLTFETGVEGHMDQLITD